MFFLFSATPKNWLIIVYRKSNVYLHYTLTKIKSQIIKKTEEPGKGLKNGTKTANCHIHKSSGATCGSLKSHHCFEFTFVAQCPNVHTSARFPLNARVSWGRRISHCMYKTQNTILIFIRGSARQIKVRYMHISHCIFLYISLNIFHYMFSYIVNSFKLIFLYLIKHYIRHIMHFILPLAK